MPRRLHLLATVPALFLGLTACGGDTLDGGEVSTTVADQLEEQAGSRPNVDCPEEIPAEVGSEVRCTLSVDGEPDEYGVTVTITSVEGDTAEYEAEVDSEPMG